LAQTLQKLTDMPLKLAIISNTFLPGRVLDRHLEQFGIKRFFPVRVYSSQTIYRKPDSRIYRTALEKSGVSADQAVMVGDKIREDINGPAKIGIKAIFKRGIVNKTKKVPPNIPIINNIAELPGILS